MRATNDRMMRNRIDLGNEKVCKKCGLKQGKNNRRCPNCKGKEFLVADERIY